MTPQILCTLFYSENFFTSILIRRRRIRLLVSQRKSETEVDIELILAPYPTLSWWAVQRHIQISSRCNIFTPAWAKNVRKKALISVLPWTYLRNGWTYPTCSWYHCVRLFTLQMTVSFACGWGVNLARYVMRKFYFTPERTYFAYAFLMSSTT